LVLASERHHPVPLSLLRGNARLMLAGPLPRTILLLPLFQALLLGALSRAFLTINTFLLERGADLDFLTAKCVATNCVSLHWGDSLVQALRHDGIEPLSSCLTHKARLRLWERHGWR
jgi:hypothetical protein